LIARVDLGSRVINSYIRHVVSLKVAGHTHIIPGLGIQGIDLEAFIVIQVGHLVLALAKERHDRIKPTARVGLIFV